MLSFWLVIWIIFVECRPSVGIIRWDAWNLVNMKYDEISYYVHQDMSPSHWHYRLPYYANILSSNNVSFNNNNQSQMDQEIQFAKHAGFDYFAFDTYCKFGANCSTQSSLCQFYYNTTSHDYCPEDPAYGLRLYLSSKYRHLINFTLILLGSPVCRSDIAQNYVNLMKEDTFQTVMNNRPLIFLFQFKDNEANECGGWDAAKSAFDNIRKLSMQSGLNNPYFVYMIHNYQIDAAYSNAQKLGFDAISAYGLGGGTPNGSPFSELVTNSTNWWQNAANKGYKMVTPLSSGWDPRPRVENPPPWFGGGPNHFVQPTSQEIQSFTKDCVQFTCDHRNNVTESQTIIMYAWNECSENGACVIPTIGNGTLYIDALGKVLPSQC